jgi:DNA-binding IclR family transcriptional regulator
VTTKVPAVDRARLVLDLLSAEPLRRFRAAEVATRIGIHRASCFSLLGALTENGLVVRHLPGPTYSLGPMLVRYGTSYAATFPGAAEARRQMFRLADELGLGCLISCRLGDQMLVLDSIGVDQPELAPGVVSPLRAPSGTIYFAWSPLEELFGWLRRSGQSSSDEDRQSYVRAVAAIRARGYSLGGVGDLGMALERAIRQLSLEPDLRALSHALLALADLVRQSGVTAENQETPVRSIPFIIGPIFDRHGRVVMTLTLVTLKRLLDEPAAAEYGARLLTSTRQVTSALGGAPPSSPAVLASTWA